MSSTPPKLRSDLVIRPQRTEDGTLYVVKDPVSGQFFRFREVENFIAGQLDGETPADIVRRRTEAHFHARLSVETYQRFIGILQKADLLESGNKTQQRKTRRGILGGNLLYLRFKLLDPSRILEALHRRMGFFYTPAFIILSAITILAAMLIAVEQWDTFSGDLPRLFDIWAIPIAIGISFLTVSAHEFAHGLTCRRFGGEVREMGFMLIYFQPAFYCNVSDAWLFPDKSKRLWVSFAGPYFELFLWALATLAWRLTESDTMVNYMALMVMATSGIKTLVNFNPLIKLDGYYLLGDLLDIPNLRKKSFRYLGFHFKRVFGLASTSMERVSNRERKIYLVYGLLATVISFSLLGYGVIQMGGFLIESNEPVPLAFFVGLVGTKFRTRFGRLFGKRKATGGDDEDSDGGVVSTAVAQEAKVIRPTPSRKEKRVRRKQIRQWAWIYLGTLGAAILFLGWLELRITGPFVILPVHNADVRSEIEGIIEEIYVTEGQQVRAGDVIVRLSAREARTELQKTDALIQQTRAKMKMLEMGPTRQEVELAQTAVEKAKGRLKYALSRQERNSLLFQKNMLSRVEYENSQEQVVIAEGDFAEAKKKLNLLVEGVRPEQIEAAEGEIASLEAQKRNLEETLKRVEVRAPATGIVATPARQLEGMMRQAVTKGALIAKVYDFKKLTVEIAVSEKDIADVKVGQKVAFKARAYPDETFNGVVTSTATSALAGSSSSSGTLQMPVLTSSGNSPTSILVTTVIDNNSLRLKPGLTGQAKIYCGERKILDLITRRLARIMKVEFWSWW